MDDFQATQARTLFPRGPSLGLKALAIVAVALGLMFADARSDAATPLRSAVAIVAMPIQWAAGLPQQLGELGEHFSSRSTLMAENDALREERLHLQARLQKLDGLAAENTRIRALLLSSKQLHEQVLIGEILSASMDPYRHYVTVNKGSIDGIYEGQPLIDAHGIMGQVTAVTSLTSNAILLSSTAPGCKPSPTVPASRKACGCPSCPAIPMSKWAICSSVPAWVVATPRVTRLAWFTKCGTSRATISSKSWRAQRLT